MSADTECPDPDVRCQVADQQRDLEEHHRGVPQTGAPACAWEQETADQGLDQEQEGGAQQAGQHEHAHDHAAAGVAERNRHGRGKGSVESRHRPMSIGRGEQGMRCARPVVGFVLVSHSDGGATDHTRGDLEHLVASR